ncbi:MAG TPA: branched-chain amino acid ABC transporter permease [Burkholderiales bacterium]|nr:branched-chain amino acid ABC transporter permease [Burkholderiales bacterium]
MLDDIRLFQLTNVLVYAVALLGLNLLVGYNGQISLGHGAFYAVGAYVAAILVAHGGVAHWLAVPLGGLAGFVAGALAGLPILHLGQMHLAMATFALGAVIPKLAQHRTVETWTGGSQGIALDALDVPFGLPLSFDQWWYLFTLATLAVLLMLASNLMRGRMGRAVVAIRDQPVAAETLGIRTTRCKLTVFAVSALYAGVAGALAAVSIRYVAPGLFGTFLSFAFLIGIAVGGIGSLAGAVYGALFLQLLQFGAGQVAHAVPAVPLFAIYGIALILSLHLAPDGIAGFLARMTQSRRDR